ncbi:MAG: SDR family oxidoreductase [Anaerolineales bacterium]|nr:SDR family oxidoreductase [Anaerolineales bacterium]
MQLFQDKVALVTGGSTGIGRATALSFAAKGARVTVADLNSEEARKTVAHIEEGGGAAIFVETDVSDPAQAQAMVAETLKAFGRLDYACNNAGIEGVSAPAADMAEADWQRVIGVNLSGVFYSMKYEIPAMLEAGGAIVNMASILGQVGFANAAAYTAAKHGVLGLTKAAALEYAKAGVRVNAVCPAFIATPMLERAGITSNETVRGAIQAAHPVGRLGEPEEIAGVVTFLCSPEASFMHGEAVLVDGGYVAQ